jgi:hypothetical protein
MLINIIYLHSMAQKISTEEYQRIEWVGFTPASIRVKFANEDEVIVDLATLLGPKYKGQYIVEGDHGDLDVLIKFEKGTERLTWDQIRWYGDPDFEDLAKDDIEYRRRLGQLLKKFREERGVSRNALSGKSGVHTYVVLAVETAKTPVDFANTKKLLRAMDLTLADLINEMNS